jgi:AhpD family alkylhydroperoxidase
LNFSDALGKGELRAELREQIALLSAEINRCGYCASAHTAIGKLIGLTDGAILNARRGRSNDEQTSIALNFVRNVIVNRGQVADSDVDALREAGFTAGQIGEIVANVAINIFTNYFNIIADTEIDFPAVEIGAAA